MAKDPIIHISVRCTSRTEYDTTPLSENCRLQIGGDPSAYLDLSMRGAIAGKIVRGKNYEITITEVEKAD